MLKEDLQKFDLPDNPGVYFFKDAAGKILYVGKATSLRDRVKSYFSKDLGDSRGGRITQMVAEAAAITWEETDSVLEALILEANLIKEHQPPANVLSRDNKSFNYLVITQEDYPRIVTVRGRELFQSWNEKDIKHLYGPFPNGGQLKEALKIVRKIFPYRDKCEPEAGKPCFNRQIGLCPGVCSGEMSKAEYAKTVRNIALLFSGKKKDLLKTLEREMKAAAKVERFEEAAKLRRQVAALTHVHDIALVSDELRISTGGSGVRVECYDIAHTSGTEVVGVMVAVVDGTAAKSQYRKFKIRGIGNNDTAALAQVVSRRLSHSEWPLPRVVVVDGGKGQVNAVTKVLTEAGYMIPVIGVVKDDRHKPVNLLGDPETVKQFEKEALLADSEAHRFAITWHRRRREKASMPRDKV